VSIRGFNRSSVIGGEGTSEDLDFKQTLSSDKSVRIMNSTVINLHEMHNVPA